MVTIERENTGRFTARIGTLFLHGGKGTKAINRCYDIKEALDGYTSSRPLVVGTRKDGEKRVYFVTVNGVTLIESTNARTVYDFCDELNVLMGLVPHPDMMQPDESLPHEQPEDTPHELQG